MKSEIIAQLGQTDILLPSLIAESLSANDRVKARLKGKKFDLIKFRNGYAPDAPEILVECKSIGHEGSGRSTEYAIRLGTHSKDQSLVARVGFIPGTFST